MTDGRVLTDQAGGAGAPEPQSVSALSGAHPSRGLVERIRTRIHDAPMPTERLLDEAADRIEALEAERDAVLRECTKWAREAGEAKGRLEASEMAGVVDGWREKCEMLEMAIAQALQCTPYIRGDVLQSIAYDCGDPYAILRQALESKA